MNFWADVELAFDVLENAEVMHEFEDHVLLRVDRDVWNEYLEALRHED